MYNNSRFYEFWRFSPHFITTWRPLIVLKYVQNTYWNSFQCVLRSPKNCHRILVNKWCLIDFFFRAEYFLVNKCYPNILCYFFVDFWATFIDSTYFFIYALLRIDGTFWRRDRLSDCSNFRDFFFEMLVCPSGNTCENFVLVHMTGVKCSSRKNV